MAKSSKNLVYADDPGCNHQLY